MTLKAEITFDCYYDDYDNNHFEGCYRLGDEAWKVYYFTHRLDGREIDGEPELRAGVQWRSGIKGVQGLIPRNMPINEKAVQQYLCIALGLDVDWNKVSGPDSLSLK